MNQNCGEKCFEFVVETRGTLFAKYTSYVTVYEDRVDIKRKGRVGDIPERVTIYFSDVSSIAYTKNTDYLLSYIAFTGVSSAGLQSGVATNMGKHMLVGASSANPWSDPYGIVFKMNMYEEGKRYYNKLLDVFDKYRQRQTVTPIQSVVVSESPVDKLKKLKEIYDLGIISNEEYEEKRKKLLSEI